MKRPFLISLTVTLILTVALSGCGGGNRGETSLTAPGAPVVTPGDQQLTVQWSPVNGATSYEIWDSAANDTATASLVAETAATSCVITGLENGTTYYVWLKAKNTAGTSGFSPAARGIPGILFSDDFESYPTGSWTGGGSWTVGESSDPWTIVQEGGTKILKSALGNTGQLYVDNDGWTDYTVSARVRIDNARGTFWLYGRSSYVNQTRYEFRLQNYLDGSIDYFLEKLIKVGEVWYGYTLADAMNRPFDIASWHEVKMVLAGGNIKCYIDEELIFDYNDTADDVGNSGTNNGPPILTGGIGVDGAGDGGYSLDDVLVTE